MNFKISKDKYKSIVLPTELSAICMKNNYSKIHIVLTTHPKTIHA
jgi:hypothetical protein